MKLYALLLCLFMVLVSTTDHGAEGHNDPPGCMCLDCRAKRN